MSVRPRYPGPWRFNPLLLSEVKFNEFISSVIDDFIAINHNGTVTYATLWDSLKAFLRGQIISYSAFLNKTRKSKANKLLTEITNIDQQYITKPSPILLKRRLELQTEFDLTVTSEAERLLLRSRSTYYEHGDKPSRLLTHQLRRQAASRLISQIKDPSGSLITDPMAINSVFQSFY